MKRFLFGLTVLVLAGVIAVPAGAAPQDGGAREWLVIVENLTPAGSQPLSPPLVVVHSPRADVWSVGTIANHGVAATSMRQDIVLWSVTRARSGGGRRSGSLSTWSARSAGATSSTSTTASVGARSYPPAISPPS